MAAFNLGLSRKNPDELLSLGDIVLSKQDPEQPTPPAPAIPPALPGLETQTAALKAKHTKLGLSTKRYKEALATVAQLKEIRDADADDFRVEVTAYAGSVVGVAKGDPVLLAAPGLPLASDNSKTSEPPGIVKNFAITANDIDGRLDGTHDKIERAVSMEVQITTVHPVDGPWKTVHQPTSSTWELEDLTSGQRVWVRVRGIGPNGPGPWSDPASKIVP